MLYINTKPRKVTGSIQCNLVSKWPGTTSTQPSLSQVHEQTETLWVNLDSLDVNQEVNQINSIFIIHAD